MASVLISTPLMLMGTPDIESYEMSIFSTVAFARNLLAGVDPWFVPSYGFGVPLPSSTWLIKFPGALPAAFGGPDVLYGALWLVGEFVAGFYILKLTFALTPRRSVAIFALTTALLSFSSLGPTYKDDWPEHFAGWALFPACLWFIIRTVQAETTGERVRRAAVCAVVLGIFSGSAHQNENVTFFSGIAIVLAWLIPTRPKGVLAVACAALIAMISASDVLVPTVEGMLAGGVNPVRERIAIVPDDLTLASYQTFLEPFPTLLDEHFGRVLRFTYERQPFFGAAGLLLAAIGAFRLLRGTQAGATMPRDIGRALGLGFIVYSALTLMPAWVALGLPRMWMYRDGQTVFAIVCAAVALHWVYERRPGLARAAVALQVVQLAIVATPFIVRVLDARDARMFGYSRREPLLFERLRGAGVDENSRVMLAGEIETLIRGALSVAGVTAGTDFALENMPLVNAWYRGGATPALGGPSMDGRYGAYETYVSWKRGLRHLDGRGLDVLGITHVLALVKDQQAMAWAERLTRIGTIDLPDGNQVALFRNDGAWARASLMPAGALAPPLRGDCPEVTIYCRDFRLIADRVSTRLQARSHGSTTHVSMPANHPAGQLWIAQAVGPDAVADVDGHPRAVQPLMGAFGAIAINPGDREVTVSLTRRRGRLLSLIGIALLGCCLAVALMPCRRGEERSH